MVAAAGCSERLWPLGASLRPAGPSVFTSQPSAAEPWPAGHEPPSRASTSPNYTNVNQLASSLCGCPAELCVSDSVAKVRLFCCFRENYKRSMTTRRLASC